MVDQSLVQRVSVAVLVSYVLLLGYAIVTGDQAAAAVVDVIFVVVMLGFAWLAYRQFADRPLGLLTAGALVAAAVLQAVALATANAAAEAAVNVLLIGGLVLYLYLRRQG